MTIQTDHGNYDHPLDVIEFLIACQESQKRCAMVAVTDTEGGSVRSVGALVGVCVDGTIAGYISNGCVDADLVHQTIKAIHDHEVIQLRYGKGSKFQDIKLPCGGSIDLIVMPHPPIDVLRAAYDRLMERKEINLCIDLAGRCELSETIEPCSEWSGDTYRIYIPPKLQLRIAGVGAELMALARLGISAGFDVIVQSPNKSLLEQAERLGAIQTDYLRTQSSPIPESDDRWTAFVLMFHDHDWELDLLQSALRSEAFYIGALGSRKTHAIRSARLLEIGSTEKDIARIHGPIGLVQSLRGASMVAVSCMAEIIGDYTHS